MCRLCYSYITRRAINWVAASRKAVVLRDLKERIALTLNPDINDGMNGAIAQSVHRGARSQSSAGN